MTTQKTVTCKEVERLLDKYIDGEITVSEYQMFRTHLRECERCRESWMALERTVRQLKTLDDVKPSDSFMPKLMAALPASSRRVLPRKWKGWVLKAAAAIIIITLIGLGSSYSGYTAMVTVDSKRDEEKTVPAREVTVLPENSVVEGDLTVVNGDVYIAGKVMGDVLAVDGHAEQVASIEVKEQNWLQRFIEYFINIGKSFFNGLNLVF